MRFQSFTVSLLCLAISSLLFAESHAPLTFEMRVQYQRAIEEVYWQHRIWPKENKRLKPRLDQILPDAAIRNKVEDYLRKSNALAEYWNHPITSQNLQGEIDRMTKQTQNASMLKELFAALHNDPYLIAECFARPILVDRFLHSWYASDPRFHTSVFASWWN